MKPFPWHRAALAHLLADRARLPHALLVHGPAGIGKAEFARALAAGALCESPRAGLACEACVSCHWLSQGNHPDFREVVPESDVEDDAEAADAQPAAKAEKAKSLVIKIDQIRAVADFMALSTHRAGYRVLLVHPAEAMHPAAANALLKTLEEPPPLTLIVMVSDRPARLLATIRSRCRLLALPMPPSAEALQWLRQSGVAQPETALASAGGAPLLARDLAEPDEAEMRRRLLAELARPSGADVVLFAATVERGSMERMIYWMQTWVHDLVRTRLAGDARHHGDFAPALQSRARAASLEALFELERTLTEARRLSAHPLNARLLAEHLLMAYNRATSGSRAP
ncbi:MAG: DNA polymerase III subunit delta' [Pseudomonadota bacterium]|nr:DNA polymerase III subunit delta' [Pseudomonadota bacterium]